MSFQFEYDQTTYAAKVLNDAGDGLDAMAATMFDSVDAGEGSEFIMSTVAAVCEQAGMVAIVDHAAASHLGTAVDVVRGVDHSADDYFRKLSEAI
jgi:hypothetical protein